MVERSRTSRTACWSSRLIRTQSRRCGLSARRMRAIEKVEDRIKAQHGSESPQMAELQGVQGSRGRRFHQRAARNLQDHRLSDRQGIAQVDDFRMEFDRNDYSGEQQIVDTLTKRGKFVPTDKFDAQFDNIRQDAEEFLFDADAVQQSSLRRNAAVRPAGSGCRGAGLNSLSAPPSSAASGERRKASSPRNGSGVRASRPVKTISRRTRWTPAGSRSMSRRKTPISSIFQRAVRPTRNSAETRRARLRDDGASRLVSRGR